MGEIADAFKRIAALHAEQERDRQEMFLQVGRAIVTLSEIEEYMAEIFVVLSRPLPEPQAAKMFYEVQNIAHKLKLVDYAMMRSDWEIGRTDWPALNARISKQKFVRNVAAHASLEFKQVEEEGKRSRISLVTQAMDTDHKKTDLEIKDMKAAADELKEIQGAMHRLLIRALRHIGPEQP